MSQDSSPPTLVFIVGPPAVGKMTVGFALAGRTGFATVLQPPHDRARYEILRVRHAALMRDRLLRRTSYQWSRTRSGTQIEKSTSNMSSALSWLDQVPISLRRNRLLEA